MRTEAMGQTEVRSMVSLQLNYKTAKPTREFQALRILADRIEQQKEPAETVTVSIEAA